MLAQVKTYCHLGVVVVVFHLLSRRLGMPVVSAWLMWYKMTLQNSLPNHRSLLFFIYFFLLKKVLFPITLVSQGNERATPKKS